ncbi:unnamed protein product, partial [Ceratitis capitata]
FVALDGILEWQQTAAASSDQRASSTESQPPVNIPDGVTCHRAVADCEAGLLRR